MWQAFQFIKSDFYNITKMPLKCTIFPALEYLLFAQNNSPFAKHLVSDLVKWVQIKRKANNQLNANQPQVKAGRDLDMVLLLMSD